jgi:putative transposase
MTRTRYKICEPQQPHFVTCTIVGWTPVFTRPETTDVIFESWRFLQSEKRISLYGYVILENHLHMIASADDLGKELGDFKSYTARRIIDFFETRNVAVILRQLKYRKEKHKIDREFQLWQEGSHPQAIQDDVMMLQKLEYIHNNPVVRGFVDDPLHWRWSSARNYAGQAGLVSVVTQW